MYLCCKLRQFNVSKALDVYSSVPVRLFLFLTLLAGIMFAFYTKIMGRSIYGGYRPTWGKEDERDDHWSQKLYRSGYQSRQLSF
jgi:hypothetical protein